jgi:DNA-binding PadR family transcriptional regulator
MKIGNNEKIVLGILKKFPKIDEKQLGVLFTIISKKKGRIDTITHSLKIKGLMTNTRDFSIDKQAIKGLDLPEISISKEQVRELKRFDGIKLGKLGKSIIYLLEKTEKSSLQFLSTFFQKPTKNIYAIMQRLEEKNIVISYNSRIRRLNSAGRRYYPKYYTLTDNGKLWLEINENKITNKDEINLLLKEPEEKIQEYNLKL